MRFWICEASGVLHDGVNVQGNGGIVTGRDAAARIRLAIDRATQGIDTGLFEPKPGHVLGMYRKAMGDVDPREIDLRGAALLRASDDQLPALPRPT